MENSVALSLRTNQPDQELLEAVKDAAWGLNVTTVLEDYYTADLSTSVRQHWQVAFNESTGEAAVKRINPPGEIVWNKAASVAEAVLLASRNS